jgi:endoglucanase
MSQAGAEFGQNIPGVLNKDYTFPSTASINHFVGSGFSAMRLPFLWERLQPSLRGNFDEAYFGHLQNSIADVIAAGATAVLDPHNYARYNGQVIGEGIALEDFVDFWTRLATHYKDEPSVAFAIMNEPHDMSTEGWASAAQAAVNAIRGAGAKQLVLVPGHAWTGAHSWCESWYGTSNAEVFAGFTDPGQNFAFEFHQYLDSDASGSSPGCDGSSKGVDALAPVSAWLRDHGFRGFLGEFGSGTDDVCHQAVEAMLDHMDASADVWLGWTWWAAGPWWGDYFTSVEPNADGSDKAQTAWLAQHVSSTPASTRGHAVSV